VAWRKFILSTPRSPAARLKLIERRKLLLQEKHQRPSVIDWNPKVSGWRLVFLQLSRHHESVYAYLNQALVMPHGLQALQFNVVWFQGGGSRVNASGLSMRRI
jgi:hypothetical protein